MGRQIQKKIKQPLAEELLSSKLVYGSEVTVKMKEGALSVEITPPAAPKKPRKKGKAETADAK